MVAASDSVHKPYREIALTGKLGEGKVAVVDEEDYAYLSQFRWTLAAPSPLAALGAEGYARRRSSGKHVYMHREIMQPPSGMEVDHVRPGSGLDNRRGNLRLVDHATNGHNTAMRKNNTSGYRGVRWQPKGRIWTATIVRQRVSIHLGSFPTREQASAAYLKACDEFGLMRPVEARSS